eukprot:CAMPEP_0173254812 /NCGR_PEP_ID=MMETSP1142-20121109/22142_1 /TAXON_ID=483371 /ORGANISM="non described non described, Strain CCMP2298" /LENGTH=202 /DNA_ID=CAMNT_0014188311 /DNA_START=42 /DNA_END=651 /DNA_ORIENTATION=+
MYRAREGCVYGYGLQVVEAAEVDGGAAVQRVARDAAHEALVPLDLVARVGVPRLHHAASRRVHSLYDDDDLHLSVAHEELHHLPLLRLPVGAAGPAAVVAAVAGACRGAAHLCQLPPKRLREEAVRGAAALGGGGGGAVAVGRGARGGAREVGRDPGAHLGGDVLISAAAQQEGAVVLDATMPGGSATRPATGVAIVARSLS